MCPTSTLEGARSVLLTTTFRRHTVRSRQRRTSCIGPQVQAIGEVVWPGVPWKSRRRYAYWQYLQPQERSSIECSRKARRSSADDAEGGIGDKKLGIHLKTMDIETLHILSVEVNRDDSVKLSVARPMLKTCLRLSLGIGDRVCSNRDVTGSALFFMPLSNCDLNPQQTSQSPENVTTFVVLYREQLIAVGAS
jgi:hypothetical protein